MIRGWATASSEFDSRLPRAPLAHVARSTLRLTDAPPADDPRPKALRPATHLPAPLRADPRRRSVVPVAAGGRPPPRHCSHPRDGHNAVVPGRVARHRPGVLGSGAAAALDRPHASPAIPLDELMGDRIVVVWRLGRMRPDRHPRVLCGTSLTLQDVQANDLARPRAGPRPLSRSNKRRPRGFQTASSPTRDLTRRCQAPPPTRAASLM